MFSATFIFKKKQFDEAFHQLDQKIAEFAQKTTGYIGEDCWENERTGYISTVYYWKTREGLEQLIHHPAHLQAKAQQEKWLDGYQIIISEVHHCYGDGKLTHPTSEYASNHPITT